MGASFDAHLAVYYKAEILRLGACSNQHLILHPLPHLQLPTQQLLQLRGPQLEEAAALMQPVAYEPAGSACAAVCMSSISNCSQHCPCRMAVCLKHSCSAVLQTGVSPNIVLGALATGLLAQPHQLDQLLLLHVGLCDL